MSRFAIFVLVWTTFQGACLFLSGGTIHWPVGWGYLSVSLAFTVVAFGILDPELIQDRLRRHSGVKRWDPPLAAVGFLFLCPVTLVVAGFDAKRYSWSPLIPLWVEIATLAVFVLGYGFALWAMKTNRFFVKFVRIQAERGHHVINSGPYAYIRHPGYAGAILGHLALPIGLGSLWGLAPACLGAILFIVRTWLEDRTLQAELTGYSEYSEQVRWRLVPGIW
ncbi:MAG: isoprenylcysteine carboxylmethyltransferase family protein [Candidatus Omnitrophica bacterium]|nr:isoprenylcysteine carboxylmethyltransferase family protein [Candidatus Omnitrophota bacterium]MCA9418387.1 isoprenylcysteine carboxylmethyltransferase family protein [Candidatus Omnitrophota bacterium]MCB9768600.1 isoprenylcysteine carboxylmethyltransferase family protein [Candidatus Omnitrophota bacterium]